MKKLLKLTVVSFTFTMAALLSEGGQAHVRSHGGHGHADGRAPTDHSGGSNDEHELTQSEKAKLAQKKIQMKAFEKGGYGAWESAKGQENGIILTDVVKKLWMWYNPVTIYIKGNYAVIRDNQGGPFGVAKKVNGKWVPHNCSYSQFNAYKCLPPKT